MANQTKLYPPYVEPSIPAQLVPDKSTSETTTILTVPFQLNKAVSWVDLKEKNNISLILKTVSTGKILLDGFLGNVITYNAATGTPAAQFEIPKTSGFTPVAGQYYKIQIAFIDTEGIVGYFSDVTIAKFTSVPTVQIADLSSGINSAQYSYTGTFKTDDISEKVYSYEFNIFDNETGLLYDTSGVLIHNSNTDVKRGESFDTWTSYKTLVNERQYSITYKITTLNGLIIETAAYGIMAVETLDLVSKNTEFIATLHSDDAYVNVHILPKDIDASIKAITGNFVLVRATSEDNFSSWSEIYRFTLVNNYPLMTLWKDFTVQQGYSYKYAVQAYNSKGVYSNRLECKYYLSEADERDDDQARGNWNSETNFSKDDWHYLQDPDGSPTQSGLPVDFEDAFLYDGKRQLKIRYNPKVSSFKSTLLETKVDTIGGKYPFIFRNGNVEYKEFAISGLITLLSDENSLFMDYIQAEDLPRQYTLHPPYDTNNKWHDGTHNGSEKLLRSYQEKNLFSSRTALSAENFRREREFKMEVLDWLTNGEPKLFRSPGEGNFIVRLMNTSLTPNDQLSRMLHTFQCTAYEIAAYDFNNLEKYKFINALETSYQELKFKMIDAHNSFADEDNRQMIIESGAYYLAVIDQWSHWALRFTYANGTHSIINVGNSTGQYLFDRDALKNNPIVSITYQDGAPDVGSKILYGFYDTSDIAFSLISHIERETIVDQIIGHPETSYRLDSFQLNYIPSIKNGLGYRDLAYNEQKTYGFDEIPRRTIGKFYYLKAEPREITKIFLKNGKYYETSKCDYEIRKWDDTYIYNVYTQDNNQTWKPSQQYSGRPSNNIKLDNPSYLLKLNAKPNNGIDPMQEEFVDLSLRGGSGINAPITTGRYELYFDLDSIESLSIGSGVVCEICYNLNTIYYEVENKTQYTELTEKYNTWQNTIKSYKALINTGNSKFSGEVERARLNEEQAYHAYLNQLNFILTKLQKDGETYYAL